ncbi:hypothetical protein OG471_01260 [Streptomyces sp. NBC_01336]|uniref:hypothetical protein n=1 Tax=Streptomyces sp. NBC_01336 TaxID=2903829 RepID=UPI002E15FBF2|nr:hypothetical protein OG471_01260 [Streptomyces sp. NBC_01336]
MDAAAGGGQHLLSGLVGAESGPAQGCDVVAEVGDQGAAAVVSAVAFVHLRECVDHVADGGDLGHADGVACARGGGAGGNVLDVVQG